MIKTLHSVGAIIVIACFFSATLQADAGLPERGIAAHGGAVANMPANTIPAFREAVRLGAHMISFSVQQTPDGMLVVGAPEGTNIAETDFAELRKIDAGKGFDPSLQGTQIPTLAEVLEAMPRNVWLLCRTEEDAIVPETLRVVLAAGREKQTILGCKTEGRRLAARVHPDAIICNFQHRSSHEDYVASSIENQAAFMRWRGNRQPVDPKIAALLKSKGVSIIYQKTDLAPSELETLFRDGVQFVEVNKDLELFIAEAKAQGIPPNTEAK